MTVQYTGEQYDIIEYLKYNDGILLVNAGAGCGKSFMGKQAVLELKPKKGLYTAFNKAIVEEGKLKFKGTGVVCKTLHAVAYEYVQPEGPIEDFSYTCFEEKHLSYPKKLSVIQAMDKFFLSASVDMCEFYDEYFKGFDDCLHLVRYAEKYTNKMVNGEISPTFSFLLKYFHLLLVEGSVKPDYDLVILDEINDTTAVALEIFKLIQAPKKLGLGEPHQAIYQFMHLVDGFEELEDEVCMGLRQSFRCSEDIANRIEMTMRKDVDDTFRFKGTINPVRNGKTLYCTATNASIVKEISKRLENNQGFTLLRDPKDIFAAPLALTTASSGKKPYQKKYFYLAKEYERFLENRNKNQSFISYVYECVDDDEIKNACRLVMTLNKQGINIFNLYKETKEALVDPGYTISTVFTSKGLEFETVYIDDGLNEQIKEIKNKGGVEDEKDIVTYRCYYVACSRAGVNLHNATQLYDL